jgi:NAD(P)-dependent dehydrogenase (short-subunit alcohol dehydrogenase family)
MNLANLIFSLNNAAEQHPQDSIEDITSEQLERTFRTNIFSMFFMTKAAMKHLHEGSAIVNTTSVTAYKGSPQLLDYSSTKGAIVAFTRSLSQNLVEKGIRVNAVAPGPIWTPLIPSLSQKRKLKHLANKHQCKERDNLKKLHPLCIFSLDDSSYFSGQVLHPNGGAVVNG